MDCTTLTLPEGHLALVERVRAVNENTVVVLSNGGVVLTSPWDTDVPAILETWLLGQAGGGAIADVLFGVVNPSGRLAETVPLRLEDHPSYLTSPVSTGSSATARASTWATADLMRARPTCRTLRVGPVVHDVRVRRRDRDGGEHGIVVTVPVTNTGDRRPGGRADLRVRARRGRAPCSA